MSASQINLYVFKPKSDSKYVEKPQMGKTLATKNAGDHLWAFEDQKDCHKQSIQSRLKTFDLQGAFLHIF